MIGADGAIQGDSSSSNANAILFADNEGDDTQKSDDYDSDDENNNSSTTNAGSGAGQAVGLEGTGVLAISSHLLQRAFGVFANSRFIRSLRNPTVCRFLLLSSLRWRRMWV